MKIRKRHQPIDFQALADDEVAPMVVAFKRDAATDGELAAPEFPMAEPHSETETAAPLTPPPAAMELSTPAPQTVAQRPDASAISTTAAREPALRIAPEQAPPGWPIYLGAAFVSILWAGAPIAFAYGYRQAKAPFDFDPFVLAVLGAMAVGPAAMVWIAAYMIRQGQKLGAEAGRAKALADEMISPAVVAGVRAGDVVREVREEIARAGQVADEARETLHALRQALASESDRLIEAAANSQRTAHGLADSLSRERTEMAVLAQTLDRQATSVSDTITQQARMVAEASDLAETQLREAEAMLAARAADLTAAAGEASDAARNASEDLNRHIIRLESAGTGVAEQISAVEQGLGEQRAGLVTVAHTLRADQESFAAETETQAAQLSEFITQARLSVTEMGDRALKGGETLRQLIAEAADQFRELAEAAKAERDEFGQSTLHSLEAVSDAAAQERAKLEAQTHAAIEALAEAADKTRAAAERHAETARDQVDQLSEAAFAAGQKANSVFEIRLAEARELIEKSANMVEQAGAATARKLDEGAATARATLDELAGLLSEIEVRAARLPGAARGQAEQVRQAVTESIDELMEHARRTAEETQAIDAAFQDRVRRNYDMLSEAVRLMGSVAGAAGAPQSARERPAPPPLRVRAPLRERPAPPPAEALELDEPLPDPPLRTRLQRPAPPRFAPIEAVEPEALELDDPLPDQAPRTRLRLTPTATDEEFAHVFDQAGGQAPAAGAEDGEGWTWKDLLTSLDEGGDEGAHEADDEGPALGLEEVLAGEITAMGIDPTALLPRGRVEEIAAAVQAGDDDGARDVVRRLAPAATRRLARRLFTDARLKQQAIAYLDRYQDLLADAARRDPEGFKVATLLSSDAGRVYLLIEAAAGDLV